MTSYIAAAVRAKVALIEKHQIGDVAGPYQFTHTAAHQAWYAAVNALFGGIKSFRADYRVIPWATYTDPEAAISCLDARLT